MSQNEAIKNTFDAIIDVRSIDQAVDLASKNRSTILFSVETRYFLQDEAYRSLCAKLARQLRKSKLKFVIVGTEADKLREDEDSSVKDKLRPYFTNEPVVLYSALFSLGKSFSVGITKTQHLGDHSSLFMGLTDAKAIASHLAIAPQAKPKEKQAQDELTNEVQKKDTPTNLR